MSARLDLILLGTITLLLSGVVFADEKVEGKVPARKALFGELHIHTSWSFDAYTFKVRASPDDAYRFAKGEPIKHPLGMTYQLSRPLDFMAVTDHGKYLGALPLMDDPSHSLSKLPLAKKITSNNPDVSASGFSDIIKAGRAGTPIKELSNPQIAQSTWNAMIESANRNNEPGRFSTFIGYEWTSSPEAMNLHRNVIFKGDNAPVPFTALDSGKPEDLWTWMEEARQQGYSVLAIPHNSNLSDGMMFEREDSWGQPFTAEYAERRMRNEPLVEVTQVKGTSETHPTLSPNDEFADFELLEQRIASAQKITRFKGGYVRDAYRTGLELSDEKGINPYRFGLIGSTDSHTGIVPVEENNYSGKIGAVDGTPERRMSSTFMMDVRKFGASGLAAVWAEENTRENIFEAMERKETWATTGPRIQLRFFGGWDMSSVTPDSDDWVTKAYAAGVSMGGTLKTSEEDAAPTFVVWALKDVEGANLDRVQIIKGWSDKGVSQEKIYDVALSDGRSVDRVTGKAPLVGNTVNLDTLEYTNNIGAIQLSAVWTDPDFDPRQNAFYYVRALEIPTPRWSTFDAKKLGIEVPEDLPATIQERAYSSPIWYNVKSAGSRD